MFRFFRFFKNIYLLKFRLAEDEKRQKEEGYSLESGQTGPERYDIYREGDREASVVAEYNFSNDVVIFTDSFKRWSRPYGEELSEFDFLKVKNRTERYFACWGGRVTFDETPLPTMEDFAKDLEKAGIPYEDVGNGVIQYSVDVDEERKRKGGFFNR